jgi:hypothetical protein
LADKKLKYGPRFVRKDIAIKVLEDKESMALHLTSTFFVRKKAWHNTVFVFNIATSIFVG